VGPKKAETRTAPPHAHPYCQVRKTLLPHHGTAQAGPPATKRDPARETEIRGSRPRPNPDLLRQREIRPTCVGFRPDLSFSHPYPTPTTCNREIRLVCVGFWQDLSFSHPDPTLTTCDREGSGRRAWVFGQIPLSLTSTTSDKERSNRCAWVSGRISLSLTSTTCNRERSGRCAHFSGRISF
jgi:hypothetical protein